MKSFSFLRETLNRYHILPENSWQAYLKCCRVKQLNKGDILYKLAELPNSFAFINQGLMRAYTVDEKGGEFNKNFFAEGRFPGCMTALLKQQPSFIQIQALEQCEIVEINFKQYRALLFADSELMQLHIRYLEAHWLIEKEPKEIGYLQDEAKARYLSFLATFAEISERLTQYHIASYLGITPTQLSRIKKQIN